MVKYEKKEGKGKVQLKRQLRANMMGKWRKYRNMWKSEVDKLMRETVEATGGEKSAEKKASLNPLPRKGKMPPYNEKLTMTELPAFCKREEKHIGIYSVILEGKETTVKVVAGMLRLKTINQMDSHYESMTGQRESEQAQIREDRQDSRERGRQMNNFKPNAESTPFEKNGARDLGKGLLGISEQATELVDEIADKHEELTKNFKLKINGGKPP